MARWPVHAQASAGQQKQRGVCCSLQCHACEVLAPAGGDLTADAAAASFADSYTTVAEASGGAASALTLQQGLARLGHPDAVSRSVRAHGSTFAAQTAVLEDLVRLIWLGPRLYEMPPDCLTGIAGPQSPRRASHASHEMLLFFV